MDDGATTAAMRMPMTLTMAIATIMMGVDDYDDDDGCVLTMMMIYLGNGRWHVVGV